MKLLKERTLATAFVVSNFSMIIISVFMPISRVHSAQNIYASNRLKTLYREVFGVIIYSVRVCAPLYFGKGRYDVSGS